MNNNKKADIASLTVLLLMLGALVFLIYKTLSLQANIVKNGLEIKKEVASMVKSGEKIRSIKILEISVLSRLHDKESMSIKRGDIDGKDSLHLYLNLSRTLPVYANFYCMEAVKSGIKSLSADNSEATDTNIDLYASDVCDDVHRDVSFSLSLPDNYKEK